MTYLGLADPEWKERLGNHKQDFKTASRKDATQPASAPTSGAWRKRGWWRTRTSSSPGRWLGVPKPTVQLPTAAASVSRRKAWWSSSRSGQPSTAGTSFSTTACTNASYYSQASSEKVKVNKQTKTPNFLFGTTILFAYLRLRCFAFTCLSDDWQELWNKFVKKLMWKSGSSFQLYIIIIIYILNTCKLSFWRQDE